VAIVVATVVGSVVDVAVTGVVSAVTGVTGVVLVVTGVVTVVRGAGVGAAAVVVVGLRLASMTTARSHLWVKC
jgi:hypothetical protein